MLFQTADRSSRWDDGDGDGDGDDVGDDDVGDGDVDDGDVGDGDVSDGDIFLASHSGYSSIKRGFD